MYSGAGLSNKQHYFAFKRAYSSFTNASISSRPARRCVIPPFFITVSRVFARSMTAELRLQEAATCEISCDHMAVLFWLIRRCSSYDSLLTPNRTLPQASASLLNWAQMSHTS